MLQGEQHRFNERTAPEQVPQLLVRELPARIHVVEVRHLRKHQPLVTIVLGHLLFDVELAALAPPCVSDRKNRSLFLTIRDEQLGELVPGSHLYVARGEAVLPGLQQLHPQVRRRLDVRMESWVASWKLLIADAAIEEKHVGQYFVHRAHCPKRTLLEHRVVLRSPHGYARLRDEHGLLRQFFLKEALSFLWLRVPVLTRGGILQDTSAEIIDCAASDLFVVEDIPRRLHASAWRRFACTELDTNMLCPLGDISGKNIHIDEMRIVFAGICDLVNSTCDAATAIWRITLYATGSLEATGQNPHRRPIFKIRSLHRCMQKLLIIIRVLTGHRHPLRITALAAITSDALLQHRTREEVHWAVHPPNLARAATMGVGLRLLRVLWVPMGRHLMIRKLG